LYIFTNELKCGKINHIYLSGNFLCFADIAGWKKTASARAAGEVRTQIGIWSRRNHLSNLHQWKQVKKRIFLVIYSIYDFVGSMEYYHIFNSLNVFFASVHDFISGFFLLALSSFSCG